MTILVNRNVMRFFSFVQVKRGMKGTVMSKQYGHEDFLSELISSACISILPEKTTFNVDNVRIVKIPGSAVTASSVVQVGIVWYHADLLEVVQKCL